MDKYISNPNGIRLERYHHRMVSDSNGSIYIYPELYPTGQVSDIGWYRWYPAGMVSDWYTVEMVFDRMVFDRDVWTSEISKHLNRTIELY